MSSDLDSRRRYLSNDIYGPASESDLPSQLMKQKHPMNSQKMAPKALYHAWMAPNQFDLAKVAPETF